jgi:hypothetical protein
MRIILRFTIWVAAATIVACTLMAPIRNVDHAQILAPAGTTLTDDQVRAAIIRAGASLGWQIRDAGPGKLIGTLALRKHVAEIEIPYSPTHYSILYKSSINLNESGGNIHKNYNNWIYYLTQRINVMLAEPAV